MFILHFRSSETTAHFWTITVAVSLIPFIVWGYYLTTWDVASLQSHCKDIISRHLYKAEIQEKNNITQMQQRHCFIAMPVKIYEVKTVDLFIALISVNSLASGLHCLPTGEEHRLIPKLNLFRNPQIIYSFVMFLHLLHPFFSLTICQA